MDVQMPRHIVIEGPPGAGKSTQADLLAQETHLPHVGMGDIVRDEIAHHTPDGVVAASYADKGDLVPADIIARMFDRRMAQPDVQSGFILEGFPRRIDDAQHLLQWADKGNIHDLAVVGLQVSAAQILDRVKDRRVCPNGDTVTIDPNKPEADQKCPKDGLPLQRRPDDDPAVVAHRMDVYREQTQPTIDLLKAHGFYHEVDGSGTIAQTYALVRQTLLSIAASAAGHPGPALC